MLDITLPEIEQTVTEPNHARFKIEPLEPGWGHTLGSSLRRILTNSLPGAAFTAVRLDPEPGDDGHLPQVEEDLIDLILNVKQLRVRYIGTEPVRAQLKINGKAGRLPASSLTLPEGVELLTPDLDLATSTGKGQAILELNVQTGFGYSPAEQHADSTPFDMTPIDALYSPLPRVTYTVENTRLGQRTDYDRLLIDIWTDGSLEPVEALRQAAAILTRHGQVVAGFSGNVVDEEEVEVVEPAPVNEADTITIESLNLSSRTFNALKRAYIENVGQVLTMTDSELLGLRNFGQKALDELKEQLTARGFGPDAPLPTMQGTLSPSGYELGDDASGADAPEPTSKRGRKPARATATRVTSLADLAALAALASDSGDEDEGDEDEA